MEIPGLSPLSNQPTLTNPLSQSELLAGQQTQAKANSETQSTVTVSEQGTTELNDTAVVTQANETQSTGLDDRNPGATIDITA